ncbi:pantetheine-phosphate adenylyltransferase [Desulfobaculum bizertense]|uniref:Phosphopantetheine adenylyltransferase n=1 Tax=Desulfobaculum bizertense DSM 18034 TaxID=1121442 RepID=A0A1T4WVJ3_9BACT|nr:pantetheine-phosphate adenylyltransferase [Desulfobaculum bizertense]UIJ38609.1 pantetheine-phosphate adenylyltransferase [Desulfobaculum bizertense]SKA81336.1 Phosphopantetheine adenylyltransferase [Desulfobaculum bizertense DSM 18034]
MEEEKKREVIAVYPGTFDPLTNGHVSLVKRGLTIFDKVVVAVAQDTGKNSLFSFDERVEMAREVFADSPRVMVEGFSGLLVNYALKRGASVILRGLRAVSDFEYEFQMALMNRHLARPVQTVFLMTDYKWMYISSSIIRSVASLDGNVQGLIPNLIMPRVYAKFAELKERGELD